MNAARRRKIESRKHAVALQYSSMDDLPRVIASGAGELARHILELAWQHNIPVHEDTALSEILAQLPLGAAIPEETFRLVAEVVCFLYFLDEEWRKQHSFLEPIVGLAESRGAS